MKKLIHASVFVTLFLVASCSSTNLFTGVVTVTEVRDSVMKAFATHYAAGEISPATDARIGEADKNYRLAAASGVEALRIYKETGTGDPVRIMGSVKNAVSVMISILAEFEKTAKFDQQLEKASKI